MASRPLNTLPAGYRFDPQLGAVYDTIPESADDLTEIRGIETREAAGLNRLGIYFFEQVAVWTDAQIVAVADALGMSSSTILQDHWSGQARLLCSPSTAPENSPAETWSAGRTAAPSHSPALPASGLRTIALLICALLVGCFTVAWLKREAKPPMTGVLVAEITSLRVPADSRLLTTHVTAGDEVFTGEVLMTVEKTEHLEQISQQTRRVQQLSQDLQTAKAQASLELQWRSQQLQQELSEARRRVQYFETILPPETDSQDISNYDPATPDLIQMVSHPQNVLPRRQDRVNGLLFISGVSGATTLDKPAEKESRLTAAVPQPTAAVPFPQVDSSLDMIRLEAKNTQSRLRDLERLQTSLPTQIRLAAGVESLKTQLEDAEGRLEHMQSLSRETSVLCPGYGTVGQVRFDEGDRMVRGDVMVRILHTDRCYVVAHVPAERVSEMQPGAQVTVRFPDHDRCEGVVANVPMIADRQLTSGASVASVRIESTGRNWPELPIGSPVQILAH